MSQHVPETPSGSSRWPALLVLCAGTLMVILDGTIVNVALPSIQSDLGFSQASLTWVVNAYLIAFGGLLLLAGRLGDLIGRKRVFVAGLALFTAASLLCGVSANPGTLIAARFLQGVGGAMASAVTLGMIVAIFTEPRERSRAIAVYSFVGSAGASIGVIAGGVLTQAISWHWIFFVNLPIGVAAAVLAGRVLSPDHGAGPRQGADVIGAVLVTAALMLGVYTIVKAADRGWGSAHTLGLGAVSAALLAAFVLRQARAAHPLLPLRIFRSRNVSGANLVQFVMVAPMFGFQFLVALYLQRVLGYDAIGTGIAFLPITTSIGLTSLFLAARLIARFGPRTVLAAGLLLLAAGFVLLTQLPAHGSYGAHVLPALVLLGAGAGLALPTITTLAMSDATPGDSGLVSGLANTTQQVGGALGLAVLSTLAASRTDRLLGTGENTAAALTGGYHLAFATGTALMLLAAALTATALRPRRAVTPEAPGVPQGPGQAITSVRGGQGQNARAVRTRYGRPQGDRDGG
ncbi:DHA2 family efflux MFS transporter permease subunit [Streptomyces sp. NBC_01537]|uniref:DHA2 family efflux MFS transporter permease subunit n=1 Tax=Streptomyces sp. NBC_01537 TaxID=2903896 RepID=UPI00386366AE